MDGLAHGMGIAGIDDKRRRKRQYGRADDSRDRRCADQTENDFQKLISPESSQIPCLKAKLQLPGEPKVSLDAQLELATAAICLFDRNAREASTSVKEPLPDRG
jgi:hypothetical protein